MKIFMILFGLWVYLYPVLMYSMTAEESRPKAALLLFDNRSGKKDYPAGYLYRTILHQSLYDLTKPLKFIKILDQSKTTNISWKEKKLAEVWRNTGADLIIYGNYNLSGPLKSPDIKISVSIYQSLNRKTIFNRVYQSSTDRRIFDTIDMMMTDVVKVMKGYQKPAEREEPKVVKKQRPPEVHLSVLILSNFSIGSSQYHLYVNNEWMDLITGNDYSLKLAVLAGENYKIAFKRNADDAEVFQTNAVFMPKTTNWLNYEAKGVLMIRPLQNKEQWKTYRYFLNGIEIGDGIGEVRTNAGIPYEYIIVDNLSNRIFSESSYLEDSGKISYNPELKWIGGLHGELYKTEETYIGAGLDYLFNRYLWVGAGAGFWTAQDPLTSKSIVFLYPYAEVGYYFWGDLSYPLRAGAGLMGEMYLCYPETPNASSPVMKNAFYGIGAFITGEYLVFFLRPSIYYDFQQVRTQIAVGIKF